MFENVSVSQFSNNNLGGTSSAKMHLFSPRLFSNQGRRPIAYKFDSSFVPAAIDAIAHKTATQNGVMIDALTKNPSYMGAIAPTWNPDYMLDMRSLSNYWTFMLIVNNDKTGSSGITRSMADNLQIYYGYFLDEPVNPLAHFGRMSLNHNAVLMITHKTIVNKSSYVSQVGHGTRIDTMADIDIIPTKTMAALSNIETVAMRPEDIYQNVYTGLNDEIAIMHDESKLLANMDGSLDVHSRLSVPKHNIKKILDSVADAQSDIQASAFNGVMVNLGQDSFNQVMSQNIMDKSRTIDIGLSTNILITLGHIIQRYDPSMNKIDLPFNQPYDTFDQSQSSAKAVFSSMLSTILPSIMADFVIAQFTFRYESYHDVMEVYGFAPITPMGQAEMTQRINSLIFRLKAEIFPILKMQHGDFDLKVNCDCTSVTHVNLNFYADSQETKEIFEVPTLLGGFNSPLVGSANIANNNSLEMGGLIREITESDRDIPLGSHDVTSYNRSLTAYDDSLLRNMQPGNNFSELPAPRDWRV